jgi:hypothetical protein
MQITGFYSLPFEVVRHIFAQLPLQEGVQAQRVCRLFHLTMQDSYLLTAYAERSLLTPPGDGGLRPSWFQERMVLVRFHTQEQLVNLRAVFRCGIELGETKYLRWLMEDCEIYKTIMTYSFMRSTNGETKLISLHELAGLAIRKDYADFFSILPEDSIKNDIWMGWFISAANQGATKCLQFFLDPSHELEIDVEVLQKSLIFATQGRHADCVRLILDSPHAKEMGEDNFAKCLEKAIEQDDAGSALELLTKAKEYGKKVHSMKLVLFLIAQGDSINCLQMILNTQWLCDELLSHTVHQALTDFVSANAFQCMCALLQSNLAHYIPSLPI